MASLQDAAPVKDEITESEVAVKEPKPVASPPPLTEDPVLTLDVEDDEEGIEDLEAPPYEGKLEDFDDEEDEEEKDPEYSSPFVETEDVAAPFRWGTGEAATFGDFNEDDGVPEYEVDE